MVFHMAQRKVEYPKFIINNVQIEMVKHFNGIINATIKWHAHINCIAKKPINLIA